MSDTLNFKDRLSTREVLRYKFPENEYVLIEEVSDASGFSRSRSLDYMLINLWNSRGLAVTGIEQKSNRGDWLKELKNPQKQENHFKYCDYFYLLTDKEGIAKVDEIPPTWGWYHINEKQILKTIKTAPKLESLPVNRSLMCAMLRRAACKEKYVHEDSIKSKIAEEAAKLKGERNYTLENKAKSFDDLKATVDAFEQASGIKIRDYYHTSKQLGEAVRLVLDHGIKNYKSSVSRIVLQMKNMYEAMQIVNDKVQLIEEEKISQE